MSKFIYFQDGHCQGVNSRNRLGNYFEDWLLKFDELLLIAKEKKCDAILDGGDLLEIKNPAYSVLDEIADRVENSNITFYSLFGNHSMHCGHIENSNNTGLAHLQKRSKLFKILNRLEGSDYIIHPIEYAFNVEEKIKTEGIIIQPENKWKVVIVHAMITPGSFFKGTSYIQYKDIKTNADLVLCGHYHQPFDKKIDKTTFLNIGCFGRLNINESKIEPSVLILDTNNKSYEIIKLKMAKKPNEIFDLVKYEELKSNEKSIEEFISLLNSTKFQLCDIGSQINLIGKENNIDENIINYLLEKIKTCNIGE